MENISLTAPEGFLTAGIKAGLKRSGKEDLGVIYCPDGAKAGAVFTTNKIVSAAVEVCRKNLASQTIYGVVVNSGNANTCTGVKGLEDASSMCKKTSELLGKPDNSILLASTGIIGEKLPMNIVLLGIEKVVEALLPTPQAGNSFAKAIMTTDTVEKEVAEQTTIAGAKITIAGAVKGAGMIAPNMATTLCFITTDANISKEMLQKALSIAIGGSLNRLTVDGHQSTNDTAIILSSCKAKNPEISTSGKDFDTFSQTLCAVCDKLAKKMAHDAEGATRIFKVMIKGAKDALEARKAARAVADYDLVKCAINGGDPNWGRIICAVGSCGISLNPNNVACKLNELVVFEDGQPVSFDRKKASEIVSSKEHTITVELGAGDCDDYCYGCDLSKEYVAINADYHT